MHKIKCETSVINNYTFNKILINHIYEKNI